MNRIGGPGTPGMAVLPPRRRGRRPRRRQWRNHGRGARWVGALTFSQPGGYSQSRDATGSGFVCVGCACCDMHGRPHAQHAQGSSLRAVTLVRGSRAAKEQLEDALHQALYSSQAPKGPSVRPDKPQWVRPVLVSYL